MKKLIYSLLILALPAISMASSSEFSYNKDAVSAEFSSLEKISSYVDETHFSYAELSNKHVFEGDLELTNHISVNPNSVFSDMDWAAYAWGLLCCPIGAFLYLLPSRDKSDEEKSSFYYGIGTWIVVVLIAGIPLGYTTVTF